jgi:hypothetical protein
VLVEGRCRRWPRSVREMNAPRFDLVCEIEPPTKPDLRHVRHQIGVLAPVAHSFLIPDNHIGRATGSSLDAWGQGRARKRPNDAGRLA